MGLTTFAPAPTNPIVTSQFGITPIPPEGRLTLTSGTPVLTGAVATAATVYYTPYLGNQIPIWDGTKWVNSPFTELSNILANSATGNAGPAAGAASKNYDLFVSVIAGVLTLTRGGAWNSDTVRSATTENDLQRVGGFLCNLNNITNGPLAGFGLYVGTIRTDAGGATVSWALGGSAAGGTPATINLWNAYNRNKYVAAVSDSNGSWSYTAATIRASDNNNGNRISMIRGLDIESVEATFSQRIRTAAAAGGYGIISIGLDSTSAASTQPSGNAAISLNVLAAGQEDSTAVASYDALPGLGFHYLQAQELGDGVNATTFNGANHHHFKASVMA